MAVGLATLHLISLHFPMKPGFGDSPVAFDGRGSNAHHVSCLLDGEAAKVTQLDHLRFLLVERGQSFERIVERDEFGTAFDGAVYVLVQREFLEVLATLFRVVLACVIHQQAAHDLGGNAEKVGPVLPVHARLIDETQISFVDQSGRLQSVIRAFTPQIIGRKLTQFIVDDG